MRAGKNQSRDFPGDGYSNYGIYPERIHIRNHCSNKISSLPGKGCYP
jgi:hypothetical protein